MKTMKALTTVAALAVIGGCSANELSSGGGADGAHVPAPRSDETAAPPDSGARPGPGGKAAAKAAGARAPTLSVEDNLARLRALRIFDVGQMENQIPEDANCYGSPTSISYACTGHEKEFNEGKAAAEKRLSEFTVAAESAVARTPDAKSGPFGNGGANLDANLEILRNLHIVEVGALILDLPESATCYGFCQASNETRALQVMTLAALATAP